MGLGKTEDDGFFYTTDHNYTTPWDFRRDVPAATHVVIHIGYGVLHVLVLNFFKTVATFSVFQRQ